MAKRERGGLLARPSTSPRTRRCYRYSTRSISRPVRSYRRGCPMRFRWGFTELSPWDKLRNAIDRIASWMTDESAEVGVFTRREFLKAGAAITGGLVVQLTMPGTDTFAAPKDVPPFAPNAFIRIAPDGSVALVMHKV